MRSAVLCWFLVGMLAGSSSATDGKRYTLELMGGAAANLNTTLELEQAGEPTVALDAEWETRPRYAVDLW